MSYVTNLLSSFCIEKLMASRLINKLPYSQKHDSLFSCSQDLSKNLVLKQLIPVHTSTYFS
jgi:hypothetical protein